MEDEITRPLLILLRHLSRVCTENHFSINQDNPNITSLFATSKTSVSIPNLPKTEQESITLHEVFTTKFPS